MSFANLTGLNIGSAGTLAGKRFTVAGRVVMGMEEEGQTYRWNEFHLVDDTGQSTILVYEVTEDGAEWKLFTYIETPPGLTAEEAAAKRVGDSVIIEGQSAQITLVDESKVAFIEGRPPEGVERGDIAKYFNATANNRMYVVSWTGDEVEVFTGMTLPNQAVASAFNIRRQAANLGQPLAGPEMTEAENVWPKRIVTFFAIAAVIGAALGGLFSCRSSSRTISNPSVAGPIKHPTAAAPLTAGGQGQLWGKPWRVNGHALTEIQAPGLVYDRHEYYLAGDNDQNALLIYGLGPGKTDWWLFERAKLDTPLSPVQAGAKRGGDTVQIQGQPFVIRELFMSTVRQAEGQLTGDLGAGARSYNFAADNKGTALLARWNETTLATYAGKLLPALEVKSGLGASAP